MRERTTEELLGEYRAAALAHARALQEGDVKASDRAHGKLRFLSRQLKERGEAYERGMRAIMCDAEEDPNVRVWACSNALGFAPDEAVDVLRDIARHARGAPQRDARMTLEIWEAGEWHFAW